MAESAHKDSLSNSVVESIVPKSTQDVMKMSGNDELKFGVLIGLIEVGQLSNKDVVDTVLSLVGHWIFTQHLRHWYMYTCLVILIVSNMQTIQILSEVSCSLSLYVLCAWTWFINSYWTFIKENYPGMLPTPARLKRAALRWEKNTGEKALGKIWSSDGRPFQDEGPSMDTPRLCLVEVRAKRTRNPVGMSGAITSS